MRHSSDAKLFVLLALNMHTHMTFSGTAAAGAWSFHNIIHNAMQRAISTETLHCSAAYCLYCHHCSSLSLKPYLEQEAADQR